MKACLRSNFSKGSGCNNELSAEHSFEERAIRIWRIENYSAELAQK